MAIINRILENNQRCGIHIDDTCESLPYPYIKDMKLYGVEKKDLGLLFPILGNSNVTVQRYPSFQMVVKGLPDIILFINKEETSVINEQLIDGGILVTWFDNYLCFFTKSQQMISLLKDFLDNAKTIAFNKEYAMVVR